MKKIITILLLTVPVIGLAQKAPSVINYQKNYLDPKQYDKVVFPKVIQGSPDFLKKISAINAVKADTTILIDYLKNLESINSNNLQAYPNATGMVYNLPPDNMPCKVPNMQTIVAMPTIKPLVADNMPNPLQNKSRKK